ncbi:hypothetical protein, partial [Faecalibaculum rodentium]
LSFHTDVLDLTLTFFGIQTAGRYSAGDTLDPCGQVRYLRERESVSVCPAGIRQQTGTIPVWRGKNGFCCIVSAASINTGTPGSWCVCFSVFSDCRKRGSAWLVRT